MLVFLSLNHVELRYSQMELSDTFLKVADGTADETALYQWIIDHEQ